MTLVEGKDICVHLDGRLVLDRVNISVNKGEELQVYREKVSNYMGSLHSKIKEYKALQK